MITYGTLVISGVQPSSRSSSTNPPRRIRQQYFKEFRVAFVVDDCASRWYDPGQVNKAGPPAPKGRAELSRHGPAVDMTAGKRVIGPLDRTNLFEILQPGSISFSRYFSAGR